MLFIGAFYDMKYTWSGVLMESVVIFMNMSLIKLIRELKLWAAWIVYELYIWTVMLEYI